MGFVGIFPGILLYSGGHLDGEVVLTGERFDFDDGEAVGEDKEHAFSSWGDPRRLDCGGILEAILSAETVENASFMSGFVEDDGVMQGREVDLLGEVDDEFLSVLVGFLSRRSDIEEKSRSEFRPRQDEKAATWGTVPVCDVL